MARVPRLRNLALHIPNFQVCVCIHIFLGGNTNLDQYYMSHALQLQFGYCQNIYIP